MNTGKKETSRIIVSFVVLIFLACSLALSFAGCNAIRQSMLDKVKSQEISSGSLGESTDGTEGPDADIKKESGSSTSTAGTTQIDSETAGTDSPAAPDESSQSVSGETGEEDIDMQRENFKKGVSYFEEKNYIIAEYYFNKIKDSYNILSDHILYYLAKSLLMQEKYEHSQQVYEKLITTYPDSIFIEKANIEYADLFFIQDDYEKAQAGYEKFNKSFDDSDLITYSIFQLAICQQRSEDYDAAFKNYKKIWLSYPASAYADKAISSMTFLVEEKLIGPFAPTYDELYIRGDIFFSLYLYNDALVEFDTILEKSKSETIGSALLAKTFFRTGMCYFNLRDYKTSEEYLTDCYSQFPESSYADDSLYFLGRVYTNLDKDDKALENYELLLKRFPVSNYADDALYRMGRIFFLNDDLTEAETNYQRILDEYQSGDRITDAYWELGWIQYKNNDLGKAKNTFKGMADRYGNSSLGEKGLFWQAKCDMKLNDTESAKSAFRKLVSFNTYSYYTFSAKAELENLGEMVELEKINTDVYPENPDIEEILPEIFSKDNKNTDAGVEDKPTDTNKDKTAVFSHIERAKELLLIEFYDSADREIEAASALKVLESTGILEISTLYLEAKDYIKSQKVISSNLTKLRSSLNPPYTDYLYFLLYPYGYREYIDKYSAQYGVDPLFILAVIREESRFDPGAGSYAGALGLMQIMPATGKGIAGQIGISGFSQDMLFEAETSIKMGTYYIKEQLDNFSQNKYYACGAYNGGPGAMSRWISEYGDKDIDEFIENISYDETRNYIKKVMGSYFFYQLLYGNNIQ